MKKVITIILAISVIMFVKSCNKGFEEENKTTSSHSSPSAPAPTRPQAESSGTVASTPSPATAPTPASNAGFPSPLKGLEGLFRGITGGNRPPSAEAISENFPDYKGWKKEYCPAEKKVRYTWQGSLLSENTERIPCSQGMIQHFRGATIYDGVANGQDNFQLKSSWLGVKSKKVDDNWVIIDEREFKTLLAKYMSFRPLTEPGESPPIGWVEIEVEIMK